MNFFQTFQIIITEKVLDFNLKKYINFIIIKFCHDGIIDKV